MREGASLLAGKNIVTTSAGSLGTSIALELARHGGNIEVWDSSEEALANLGEAAGAGELSVSTRLVDVTSEASVEGAARSTIAATHGIDGLVCAVALLEFAPVASMSVERWRRVIDVNLTGVFLCNRAFVEHMVGRRRGSIVNLSSIAGRRGSADLSAYSASKFALTGFTQSLAHEVGRFGVRANIVSPGQVDAAMGDASIDYFSRKSGITRDQFLARLNSRAALGRTIAPASVANAVAYLISDLSCDITGASLEVSGGVV